MCIRAEISHFFQIRMASIHLLLLVISTLVYVNMETIESSASTDAVQCNMCVDRFNWTTCDDSARPRQCSDGLVMATHGFLAQYNTNLNGSSTPAVRQFRCFRLELEIDVSTVQVFVRGCTYDDSLFCDGWTANGAKATNCAVCSTDMCERNTTGDASLTTTTTYLPPETTTTTAVSTTEASSTSQTTSTTRSTSVEYSTSTTHSTSVEHSTSITHSPSTTTASPETPVTVTVTTDEPCIVDWTTSTTNVNEEVTSQPNNVTEPNVQTSSQGQDMMTNSTDSAKNTPSSSGPNVTPQPSVLTTPSGVERKHFGIQMIALMLLGPIGRFFIAKL